MIYLICRNERRAFAWRGFHEIDDRDLVVLRTDDEYVCQRLRGRLITDNDQVERIADYDLGRYWHELEDYLARADRRNVGGSADGRRRSP